MEIYSVVSHFFRECIEYRLNLLALLFLPNRVKLEKYICVMLGVHHHHVLFGKTVRTGCEIMENYLASFRKSHPLHTLFTVHSVIGEPK